MMWWRDIANFSLQILNSVSFCVFQRQTKRVEETEGEAGGEDHGPVQVLRPFAPQEVRKVVPVDDRLIRFEKTDEAL